MTDPGEWELTRIAALGCEGKTDSSCTASRKFLFGPDVVRIPGTARFGVLLGSGDREKPTAFHVAARAVSNYFYAIVDDPADVAWLESETGRCGEDVHLWRLIDVCGPHRPPAT